MIPLAWDTMSQQFPTAWTELGLEAEPQGARPPSSPLPTPGELCTKAVGDGERSILRRKALFSNGPSNKTLSFAKAPPADRSQQVLTGWRRLDFICTVFQLVTFSCGKRAAPLRKAGWVCCVSTGFAVPHPLYAKLTPLECGVRKARRTGTPGTPKSETRLSVWSGFSHPQPLSPRAFPLFFALFTLFYFLFFTFCNFNTNFLSF